MRFFIFPAEQGETTCINFDYVSFIRVSKTSIELYFTGVSEPMVVAKSPATLLQIAKGMDLSDSSKDLVNAL